MKPFDIDLESYSIRLTSDQEEVPGAFTCTSNGLVVVTQQNQPIVVDANDEVPLFFGVKGKMLTGKAYSVNESIRERPLIDFGNLIERLRLSKDEIEVYLGPSLTFSHIEQADEVLARVIKLGYNLAAKGTSGKHYLDHQLLVCLQMRKLGIPMEHIHMSSYDTYDTAALNSALRGDNEKNRFVAVLR